MATVDAEKFEVFFTDRGEFWVRGGSFSAVYDGTWSPGVPDADALEDDFRRLSDQHLGELLVRSALLDLNFPVPRLIAFEALPFGTVGSPVPDLIAKQSVALEERKTGKKYPHSGK